MLRRRKTTKDERICSICSQAFAKAEHLERHFRSHTKEKPFACPACDRRFARHDTLLRHSRSHHTPKPAPITTTGIGSSTSRPSQNQNAGTKAVDSSAIDAVSPSNPIQVSAGGIHTPPSSSQSVLNRARDDQMMGNAPPLGQVLPGNPCVSLNPPVDFDLSMLPAGAIPPIDSSAQQYGWLPQWDIEMGLDSQWLAALTGDNFGASGIAAPVNGVASEPTQPMADNNSWQENSTYRPGYAEPTPNSEAPANLGRAMQKKWHTFIDIQASEDVTPDSSRGRLEVDENCHRTLADRLRQHISVPEPVPPTSFLNLAIQAYFSNFHRVFPIVHAPTFQPHGQNGVVLLSICSVGSLFLGSPRAVSYGISIYERLNKAVLSSWDSTKSISRQGTSTLSVVQSSLLGQIFGLLLGRPRDILQVDLFHGTCVAWCRRLRLFDWDESVIDVSNLEGQELNLAWRKWARNEEQKNILLGLLLQDAEISGLLHHDPLLRQAPNQLPRAASREAFSAPCPSTWKAVMLQEASVAVEHQPIENSTSPIDFASLPDVNNDFELLVMLYRVGSMTLEGRQAPPYQSEGSRRCQADLISWHKRYCSTPAFKRQEANLMMLWHAIFMSLHMNVDSLERFCGRDGPRESEKCRAATESWATSQEAKICIIHAVLVQRHCESIPIGTQPPIHFPACLYRCGVAWYCYTSFADRPTSHIMADLDLTGLEILGASSVKTSLEEAGLTDGRPVASPLFKVISLLQRSGQWTIGHGLASTLLALLEDESGPV